MCFGKRFAYYIILYTTPRDECQSFWDRRTEQKTDRHRLSYARIPETSGPPASCSSSVRRARYIIRKKTDTIINAHIKYYKYIGNNLMAEKNIKTITIPFVQYKMYCVRQKTYIPPTYIPILFRHDGLLYLSYHIVVYRIITAQMPTMISEGSPISEAVQFVCFFQKCISLFFCVNAIDTNKKKTPPVLFKRFDTLTVYITCTYGMCLYKVISPKKKEIRTPYTYHYEIYSVPGIVSDIFGQYIFCKKEDLSQRKIYFGHYGPNIKHFV